LTMSQPASTTQTPTEPHALLVPTQGVPHPERRQFMMASAVSLASVALASMALPSFLQAQPKTHLPYLQHPSTLTQLQTSLKSVTSLPQAQVAACFNEYARRLAVLPQLQHIWQQAQLTAKGQASHVHHPIREAHNRYLSARNTTLWQGLFLSSLGSTQGQPSAGFEQAVAKSAYGTLANVRQALSAQALAMRGWAVLGWDTLSQTLVVTGIDSPMAGLPVGVQPLVVWDVQPRTLALFAQKEPLHDTWVWDAHEDLLAAGLSHQEKEATLAAMWQAMPWHRLLA